jgi:hypothetical protein
MQDVLGKLSPFPDPIISEASTNQDYESKENF